MNKNRLIVSPVLRIILASSILLAHLFLMIILFFLQESITYSNTEDLLVSGISGVRKSLSVAESSLNAPEYAYLFTEYDVVGKNGGFIISDSLHDIRCGKRIESCRTLEDAGIDINKYIPLSISETEIFGVPCYFAFEKRESYVIVAYIPVEEQKMQRNINVFSALGTSLIVFTLLFFAVPFLLQFLSRFSWFPSVPAEDKPEAVTENDSAVVEKDAESTGTDSVPVENAESGDENTDDAESSDSGYESADDTENTADDAEPDEENSDASGMAEYVEKMQELKKTAYKLGDERLFKMTSYLEKCGRAILSGSKDSAKFMTEIDARTPVVLKYYASVFPQQEQQAPQVQETAVPTETKQEAPAQEETQIEEQLPEPEQKVDVSPAEIFALLENLYSGACSADENAVSIQIAALSRINLPPKLGAVFPKLALAARTYDYSTIKDVIDSLRTGKRSS